MGPASASNWTKPPSSDTPTDDHAPSVLWSFAESPGGCRVKIVRIEAVSVEVPRLERFRPKTAHGEVIASRYVILQVESDDGLVGLGEVTCSPGWNGEEALGTTALVDHVLGPALIGADPRSWAEVAGRVDGVARNRPFLRAGVEMACLDLAGRALDVPAHILLGGAYRTQIETKFVLPAREVETVRGMAEDLRGLGVSTVKVKVGLGVAADVARVAAVWEILGRQIRITVDANEGWQPGEARHAVTQLAEYGVSAVEQPLPREAWEATAVLRRHTPLAIMGDESIWTMQDVHRAAETRAFDVVSVYPGKCGGLRRTLALASAAQGHGLAIAFGSNLELGVGAAAMAHCIVATPEVSTVVPADLIGPLYFESPLVVDATFVRWSGATVPSGPGLGVELDRAALEEYRIKS